jgi:hypothetical protein
LLINQSLGASSSIPYDDTAAQKDDEVQSSGSDYEMEDGTDEVAGEMDHRRDKEAEVSEEIVNQSLGASSSIPYDDTDAQKDDEVQSSGNDHEMEDRTDGVAEEMDHRQDEAEVSEKIEEAEVSQEMDVGPSGEINDR